MIVLSESIDALIDAAREASAAIDAWGDKEVSDRAEAEKDAVIKAGFKLFFALSDYDRALDHKETRA